MCSVCNFGQKFYGTEFSWLPSFSCESMTACCMIWIFSLNLTWQRKLIHADTTAGSDRSRSPAPSRNRQEQPGQRRELPGFPSGLDQWAQRSRVQTPMKTHSKLTLISHTDWAPSQPSLNWSVHPNHNHGLHRWTSDLWLRFDEWKLARGSWSLGQSEYQRPRLSSDQSKTRGSGSRSNTKLKAISESCAGYFGIPRAVHDGLPPAEPCLSSFHSHRQHAAEILCWVCDASHSGFYEHSQARKYFQLEHDKLVQAELSLRFWQDRQNLYPWASVLIFVRRAGYRCLALNLGWTTHSFVNICTLGRVFWRNQLWIPMRKLALHHFGDGPDIVLHPRSFGTSWHRRGSKTGWNCGTLSTHWGPTQRTKARFETTKVLRSSSGGLTLCYIRQLSSNIPYRTRL